MKVCNESSVMKVACMCWIVVYVYTTKETSLVEALYWSEQQHSDSNEMIRTNEENV